MPRFRTQYDEPKHGVFSTEVGTESMVQQQFAEETNVNSIMAKYQKTGLLTHVARYAGTYGDFSGVPDYKEGLERIMAAEDMFMSLPAKIRDRFNNDPAQFIQFATDEGNLEEMRKMGLAPEAAPVVERPNSERKEELPEPKAPKNPPAKGDQ